MADLRVTGVVQPGADRGDLAVHHPDGRDDVDAGVGVGDRAHGRSP
jgi:hypothetical protein